MYLARKTKSSPHRSYQRYEEFYEFINKGCVIGSQFTVKVNIDDKLIDYKKFKTFIKIEE